VPNPDDLVVVARVLDAWGLQGGIKVAPFSSDAEALLASPTWRLESASVSRDVEVISARHHGQAVRAMLEGITDRDAALTLKGASISVARRAFPALAEGEYYWVDLIGLDVLNRAGLPLGRIEELMESGAHPILVVKSAPPETGTILIPFVETVAYRVDLVARQVWVDWEKDY
jgi:16S rRNA processing protein RimM